MNVKAMLEIEDMPFCIGAMPTPHNPDGVPGVYPFRLELNHKLARLEQCDDRALNDLLDCAYRVGADMGTPSDSTDLGKPYVDDFIGFLKRFTKPPGSLLEIGAGTGYMSRVFRDGGWDVTSIEPGHGYADHWKRHSIAVVNDFFPSPKVTGKFDVIVFYTVLEHLKNTRKFLESTRAQLNPSGMIVLGVPDCTAELLSGDPSMLLHEHYQYFTARSLANTLVEAGFEARIEESKYGRSLFAVGFIAKCREESKSFDTTELSKMKAYSGRVTAIRTKLRTQLLEWSAVGEVGIYCPSRVLNYLPRESGSRFYDDATNIHGKYYPPFEGQVLSRNQLLSDPPETLLIASRTFGERLKQDLVTLGLPSEIHTFSDMIRRA